MTPPISQASYFKKVAEFNSRYRQHPPAEVWDEPVSSNQQALRSQQHLHSIRQLHQAHYLERRSL
jgi:hypothetical protein